MKRSASGTRDSVLAAGARLEKLAGGFDFTEGPTCDAEGNVFFTDQPNDRILKWGVDGGLSTFLQPAGRANGMCFDPTGLLIACADERNELWSIAPDGKVTVLVSEYAGKLLNGPNDVWVRPDGALYFTDPFYDRTWWTHHAMPQDGQHVYFLSADRRQLVRVADDLQKPNGIIGTPDGKTLYVADIGAGKTYRYDIAPDGRVTVLVGEYGGKRLNGPNDVWVRRDGALYFTDPFYDRTWWTHHAMPQDGQHVYFLSADRRQLVRVADDLQKPNGITGTPDGKTLYVADIDAGETYRYDIGPDGRLAGKTLAAEQGSDGMTLDNEGNLYLTGNGVLVFDKAARQIDRIPVPDEKWTANVSFGGKDRHTLFITASTGLYAIRMRVKGANAAK